MSVIAFSLTSCAACSGSSGRQQAAAGTSDEVPVVYFVKDITPENLVRIYECLGREAEGKVAVKLSTGEPGGHHFLNPQLVKGLVQGLRANIVECNTAYGGRRGNLHDHIRAALEHGWCDIATVDIQDGVATMALPAPKGAVRLKKEEGNFFSYLFMYYGG